MNTPTPADAGPDRDHACSFDDLLSLLAFRAAHQGKALAYTYRPDSAQQIEHRINYAQLFDAAQRLSLAVGEVAAAGERVLIAYGAGLDFIAAFFGSLGAGTIPVPIHPPLRRDLAERARHIAADAGAGVVLTATSRADVVRRELGKGHVRTCIALDADFSARESGNGQHARWTGDTASHPASLPALFHPHPDDIAFLQYTSGSTADPRGVKVTHRQVLANEARIARAFEHDATAVVAGWLPAQHDMGLIGIILQPLYLGVPCHLMSPASFLRRPAGWLELISRARATTSGAPNFAYELCARRTSPEEMSRLDLSSWRVAFCGAEPVRSHTLSSFSKRFAGAGFRAKSFVPCYGLAEATLLVTAHRPGTPIEVRSPSGEGTGPTLVGCGAPEGWAIVVDPGGEPVPDGTEGDIWVRGPCVTAGYWGDPIRSAGTFGVGRCDESP